MSAQPTQFDEQTLGEAIVAAHRRIVDAEHDRAELIVEARLHGVSLRRLSKLLGVSPSTVMRWGPFGEPADDYDPLNEPIR